MMNNTKKDKIITDTTKKSGKENKTIKLEVLVKKCGPITSGLLSFLNCVLNTPVPPRHVQLFPAVRNWCRLPEICVQDRRIQILKFY